MHNKYHKKNSQRTNEQRENVQFGDRSISASGKVGPVSVGGGVQLKEGRKKTPALEDLSGKVWFSVPFMGDFTPPPKKSKKRK
jgi:hypothetical protein